jgi:hypothetical protein
MASMMVGLCIVYPKVTRQGCSRNESWGESPTWMLSTAFCEISLTFDCVTPGAFNACSD